jgi:signal recognition particle subunit SRP14
LFDTSSAPASPTAKKVPDDPLWDLHPPEPLPILVRATDGKSTKDDRKTKNPNKVKLSTIVQPADIEGFFAKYAEVCKAGMQSLKKRDRSKRKKDKGKKKKAGTGDAEKKG